MKLCICKPEDAFPGYLNATDEHVEHPVAGCQYVEVLNIGNLEALLDAGEADEIVIPDIGKFAGGIQLLPHWVSRVAPGGIIGVGSIDINEVAARLCASVLDAKSAASVLHGGRFYSYWLVELAQMLEKCGVKVTTRRVTDLRCWAAGVRQ